MKITASDGKEFGKDNMTLDELRAAVEACNAYEVELIQKKRKEEKERIEKFRKAEEERKIKELAKQTLKKEINELTEKLNTKVAEYKTTTGESLGYILVDGKLKTTERMSIDDAFDIPQIHWINSGTDSNWWTELYKSLRQYP